MNTADNRGVMELVTLDALKILIQSLVTAGVVSPKALCEQFSTRCDVYKNAGMPTAAAMMSDMSSAVGDPERAAVQFRRQHAAKVQEGSD